MHKDLVMKALKLKRQCGVWATARWLAKQGVAVEYAVLILAGRSPI
jgi:hypothetical protein